ALHDARHVLVDVIQSPDDTAVGGYQVVVYPTFQFLYQWQPVASARALAGGWHRGISRLEADQNRGLVDEPSAKQFTRLSRRHGLTAPNDLDDAIIRVDMIVSLLALRYGRDEFRLTVTVEDIGL